MSWQRLGIAAVGTTLGLGLGFLGGIVALHAYIEVVGRFFACTHDFCQWGGTMLAFFGPFVLAPVGVGLVFWRWSERLAAE